MADNKWSTLFVIRPESDSASLEDSEASKQEQVDARDLARQISAGMSSVGGVEMSWPDEADPITADWVQNGWRPSLEFFNWSETSPGDEYGSDFVAPAPTLEHYADWWWSEDEGSTPRSITVGDLLMRRHTVRAYDEAPLPLDTFVGVLSDFDALMGPFEPMGSMEGVRTAGVVYAVDSLSPGVWDIDVQSRSGVHRSNGVARDEMVNLMCGMQGPATASATIVFVVDFAARQSRFPYERGLRELYVETGRMAQKLILAAEGHGCGSLITPATNDNVLSRILGLSKNEAPVYTVTFGRKISRRSEA